MYALIFTYKLCIPHPNVSIILCSYNIEEIIKTLIMYYAIYMKIWVENY